MKRLVHSPRAIGRTIWLTSKQVVAYVEGHDDKFFYSKILAQLSCMKGVSFEVRLATESGTPSATSDCKDELLKLYRSLKQTRSLSVVDGRKSAGTVVLFFLDKDADDRRGGISFPNSQHICYTSMYNRENHVFRHADLVSAFSSVGCLDFAKARKLLGPTDKWLRSCASSWAEWIACCLVHVSTGAKVPSFGMTRSPIHPVSSLDPAELSSHLALIASRTSLALSDVEAIYKKHLRWVRRLLKDDAADRYFNGKWYGHFAFEFVKRVASAKKGNISRDALMKAVEATVVMSPELVGVFEPSVRLLVERCLRAGP